MADQDEEWANRGAEPSSVEGRLDRLERIAEYLHEARQEASTLAVSVDTLADATNALREMLAVIETQQRQLENLDTRVTSTELSTQDFHERAMERAYTLAAIITVAVMLLAGGLYAYERSRTANDIERCLARNAQSEISIDVFRSVAAGGDPDDPRMAAILDGARRYEELLVDCTQQEI